MSPQHFERYSRSTGVFEAEKEGEEGGIHPNIRNLWRLRGIIKPVVAAAGARSFSTRERVGEHLWAKRGRSKRGGR